MPAENRGAVGRRHKEETGGIKEPERNKQFNFLKPLWAIIIITVLWEKRGGGGGVMSAKRSRKETNFAEKKNVCARVGGRMRLEERGRWRCEASALFHCFFCLSWIGRLTTRHPYALSAPSSNHLFFFYPYVTQRPGHISAKPNLIFTEPVFIKIELTRSAFGACDRLTKAKTCLLCSLSMEEVL